LKGQRFRLESSQLVAPGIIRRKGSFSNKRLNLPFNGKRGLAFTPTE